MSQTPSNPHSDEAAPVSRIGLLWHSFRSENLGVGALTVANANLIGTAARQAGYRPIFHVVGVPGGFDYSDEVLFETHFVKTSYKGVINPFSGLHSALRRCDYVFDIGGGDSFSDIYSARRYGLIISTKFVSRRANGPLILSPQTIGPFFAARARWAAVQAMRGAAQIFARDETSYALLSDLGFAGRSDLTTDVAFALPYEAPSDKDSRDLAAGPIKFGLNVSGLLYRRDLALDDKIELAVDYPALIDTMIERLLGDPRVELHLVPHVLSAHAPPPGAPPSPDDDYDTAQMLARKYPQAVLPDRFTGPSDAKSYIAGLDLFAGSRMHSTIAALSSNTAVLPLGYSRKFNGLFGSLGYGWNSDLTCETDETALARFDRAMQDIPALRVEARAANEEAQRRLSGYKRFLEDLFANRAARHA
ncbi:polysaccharide pyruvyl transferase family protein [Erythrobacter sp.]|jgi:polysaccharide pyruvyl transferase WcaK-like protein|uniref:polysaccharide pyruvyl transferase family protein n=1 Tax=Erythrobacter sp. TaxID=1042 RepID=UPI002EC6BBE5|nr:polysaccharide pyruvyl transferase family protein [Erythrobacter sp.]